MKLGKALHLSKGVKENETEKSLCVCPCLLWRHQGASECYMGQLCGGRQAQEALFFT